MILLDMSPTTQKKCDLQSRPMFSLCGKTVQWTDGHGSQVRYAEAVEEFCTNHDLFPAKNSNRYSSNVSGTILTSQLFDAQGIL